MKSPLPMDTEPSAPPPSATSLVAPPFPSTYVPSPYHNLHGPPPYPTAAPPPYSTLPPPLPGIQVQHPVGKEIVIIQQPIAVIPTEPPVYFGKNPVELQCRYCGNQVRTSTTKSLTCDGKATFVCLVCCCIATWFLFICKDLFIMK
ncbi:unnamed protein product, partial [Meganyctiphanes norvegica]